MFAICVESSSQKGMGHLYRMLNFIDYLGSKNQSYTVFINNDPRSKRILSKRNIPFITIDLNDTSIDWESYYIEKCNIKYWLNDRLQTPHQHAVNVKKNNIPLVTFDDTGQGSKVSDMNVVALPSMQQYDVRGYKILTGLDYFIFNKEIQKYQKPRETVQNILVSLGGADTHGITIKVLEKLKELHISAAIHIGPSFSFIKELEAHLTDDYSLINQPVSLIKEFTHFDLLISGGGITPFEANASGLPCLIIANELFECANGVFLESRGCAKFMGHHESINWQYLKDYKSLNIREMSLKGLQLGQTKGVKNIYQEITAL